MKDAKETIDRLDEPDEDFSNPESWLPEEDENGWSEWQQRCDGVMELAWALERLDGGIDSYTAAIALALAEHVRTMRAKRKLGVPLHWRSSQVAKVAQERGLL